MWQTCKLDRLRRRLILLAGMVLLWAVRPPVKMKWRHGEQMERLSFTGLGAVTDDEE
jgi:steroid 5-alpha reductase family enzyme